MTRELESTIFELLRSTDETVQGEGGWKPSVSALQKIESLIEAEVSQRDSHVFVTVAGGVAYVARTPPNVKVHIIDYDDLKADFKHTFDQLSSEAQSFYRETNPE